MLHAGEVAQALAYVLLLDAADVRGDACCQRIVDVVTACQREVFLLHVERFGLLYLVLSLLDVTDAAVLLQF